MDNKTPKNSEARLKANAKWNKINYESINLAIPKGTKEYYRQEATKQGYTSLNQFIKEAISEKIERG
jgi:predicted HicB family RNase H-like nuclease